MTEQDRESRRSGIGYGSAYRRGAGAELGTQKEIGSVLKGQVWMIKPDKEAKAENPCIWMQAGVVAFKQCNNYYDCSTCKYDLGMQKRVEQGKTISWRDAMRRKPGLNRICRHSLTGRIERRSCAYDYECATCDFDQFFEDVWSQKTNTVPYEVQTVKGFQVPMGYYYHDGHTWARIESGGYLRIGMDDFSLRLFGRADGLDLPLMGKELDPGKAGWGLQRENNRADVLSPVGGIITEVNSRVRENPEMAGRKPYEDGWLFMVRTGDIKGSMKSLMNDTEGLDWTNREIGVLESMIEDVAGPMAVDGGFLGEDIYGSLPDLGWKRLTRTFLKT